MPFGVFESLQSAIISFKTSDFWPHFVSGAFLGNSWVDLFHISHTQIKFKIANYWSLLTLICLISGNPCQIAKPCAVSGRNMP